MSAAWRDINVGRRHCTRVRHGRIASTRITSGTRWTWVCNATNCGSVHRSSGRNVPVGKVGATSSTHNSEERQSRIAPSSTPGLHRRMKPSLPGLWAKISFSPALCRGWDDSPSVSPALIPLWTHYCSGWLTRNESVARVFKRRVYFIRAVWQEMK